MRKLVTDLCAHVRTFPNAAEHARGSTIDAPSEEEQPVPEALLAKSPPPMLLSCEASPSAARLSS
ncbi:MAG TPA: hypothetical protein VGY54_15290, partial [Polyangiaceae bacterium]|nr:hypothetical protein [Polyangiaceae bacterium]